MFNNAKKQFQFITEVAEKHAEEKTKLDRELITTAGKLEVEKKVVQTLKKAKQTLESRIERYEEDINELTNEIVC